MTQLPRFAKNLRLLRQSRGSTQQQLGHASGLCQTHISHFERGVQPPSDLHVTRLARALGVPVALLTDVSVVAAIAPEPLEVVAPA